MPLGALSLNGSFFILDEAATTITTAGGPVSFGAQIFSQSGLTIDTTAAGHAAGAAVTFASPLNTSGPTPLTVTAGTSGAVTLSGNNAEFGAVNLSGASITLDAGFNTAGAAVTLNAPTFLASPTYVAIDTTNLGGSSGANIQFNGAVGGGSALDLTTGTGTVALGAAIPLGGLGVSGSGITLGGNVVTASGVVNITAPVTLTTNVTIDTTDGNSSAGAPIILSQVIDQRLHPHPDRSEDDHLHAQRGAGDVADAGLGTAAHGQLDGRDAAFRRGAERAADGAGRRGAIRHARQRERPQCRHRPLHADPADEPRLRPRPHHRGSGGDAGAAGGAQPLCRRFLRRAGQQSFPRAPACPRLGAHPGHRPIRVVVRQPRALVRGAAPGAFLFRREPAAVRRPARC